MSKPFYGGFYHRLAILWVLLYPLYLRNSWGGLHSVTASVTKNKCEDLKYSTIYEKTVRWCQINPSISKIYFNWKHSPFNSIKKNHYYIHTITKRITKAVLKLVYTIKSKNENICLLFMSFNLWLKNKYFQNILKTEIFLWLILSLIKCKCRLEMYLGYLQLISYKRYLECSLIQWRLSILKCTGSCGYLFHEIPSSGRGGGSLIIFVVGGSSSPLPSSLRAGGGGGLIIKREAPHPSPWVKLNLCILTWLILWGYVWSSASRVKEKNIKTRYFSYILPQISFISKSRRGKQYSILKHIYIFGIFG